MELNELRIGNLVTDEDGSRILKVSKIVNEHSEQGAMAWELNGAFGISIDRMSGIPIDESWMKRAGFKITGSINGKNQATFLYHKNGCSQPIRFNGRDNTFEPKYVHQMQNIYHALVGEELIISEK